MSRKPKPTPEPVDGKWRSRITREAMVAPGDLTPHPYNWRTHPLLQQEALEGVLDEVGWVQRIIVNERTGHVVDGHLRVELAVRRSEPAVPVLYVDLTEAEEALVLATLDPVAALAKADAERLSRVLERTSADNEALSEFLDKLADSLGAERKAKEPPPERPISKELFERHDYLVLVFDNDLDWAAACQFFDLQTVVSAQVDEKTTLRKRGRGRVLDGAEFLAKVGIDGGGDA